MEALLPLARSLWRRSGRSCSRSDGLRENITIEYRFAEQKRQRLPELAADLVRLKVDLIVAPRGAPPLAAKNATATIPIVIDR